MLEITAKIAAIITRSTHTEHQKVNINIKRTGDHIYNCDIHFKKLINFPGRVLNCFSRDIGVMDELVPVAFSEFCIVRTFYFK